MACPNHMDPAVFSRRLRRGGPDRNSERSVRREEPGSSRTCQHHHTEPSRDFTQPQNLSSGSYDFLNPSQRSSTRTQVLGSGRILLPIHIRSSMVRQELHAIRQLSPERQDSDAFAIGTAWASSPCPSLNHLMQISYSAAGDRVLYPYLMMDAIYDDADRVNFAIRSRIRLAASNRSPSRLLHHR